jgi:hypothetical protein
VYHLCQPIPMPPLTPATILPSPAMTKWLALNPTSLERQFNGTLQTNHTFNELPLQRKLHNLNHLFSCVQNAKASSYPKCPILLWCEANFKLTSKPQTFWLESKIKWRGFESLASQ